MSDHGAWDNYETYRVLIDIFEANGCLKQTVDAIRENPDYEITSAELFEIADDLFYERIGFNYAGSKGEFLTQVQFQEIADFLNIGARVQLGLPV